MNLKDKAKTFPMLPGIYRMLDSSGNVLYIGKSKCLRNRVCSYFNDSPKWEKINKMLLLTKDIEYIVCDTHLEARLLECELIKQIKPYFNAQYKSDQGYIYLKIEKYNKFRSLTVVSSREEDAIGPFRHKYSLQETIDKLSELYPMEYTVEGYSFCHSLLPAEMDEETFNRNRDALLRIFNDPCEMQKFIEILNIEMIKAADDLMFEIAAKYRDLINKLDILNNTIWKYVNLRKTDYIIKLPVKGGIKFFYTSKGLIVSKKTYEDDSYVPVFLNDCEKDPPVMDEKSYIDFSDILCSEILTLPEDSLIPVGDLHC